MSHYDNRGIEMSTNMFYILTLPAAIVRGGFLFRSGRLSFAGLIVPANAISWWRHAATCDVITSSARCVVAATSVCSWFDLVNRPPADRLGAICRRLPTPSRKKRATKKRKRWRQMYVSKQVLVGHSCRNEAIIIRGLLARVMASAVGGGGWARGLCPGEVQGQISWSGDHGTKPLEAESNLKTRWLYCVEWHYTVFARSGR